MDKRRVLAIILSNWDRPGLMTVHNDNLHYETFVQNVGSYDPKYHTIVKDYDIVDVEDYDNWDKLLVQFTRDFPPRCGVRDECGWLAPDGKFYPCKSWEHDSMADYLYRFVYGKVESGILTKFDKLGWIRVYEQLCAWHNRIEPTQSQIDTMYELYLIAKDAKKKQSLKWDLEGFGVLMSTDDKE